MVPTYLTHFPSGSSTSIVLHYLDEIRLGYFGRQKTNSTIPANFSLSKITVPLSMHHSNGDTLSDPEDVRKTISELTNVEDLYVQTIEDGKFNHLGM